MKTRELWLSTLVGALGSLCLCLMLGVGPSVRDAKGVEVMLDDEIINIDTADVHEVLAAPGADYRFRIVDIFVGNAAQVGMTFFCGATPVSGTIPLSAGSGFPSHPTYRSFDCGYNEAFSIALDADGQVGGWVTFFKIKRQPYE